LAYTGGPFAASGGQVYFEGEGYITPTEASQVPFDRKLLIGREQLNKSIASTSGAAGNTIVVNALATNFPDILLYLTARDGNGNYITGLQASQFTITEQSSNETSPHAETITSFSETSPTGSGISITLVFDVSGSMYGQPLADAKTAAINFVKACGPMDRMALVEFASYNEVRVVRSSDWVNVDANKDGTWDIIDAINSLTDLGMTALYDGTAKGIETLSQEPQPKAVIVFTDGLENDSRAYNINTVIPMAQNNGVPLYTIGLGSSVLEQPLKDMADATGGLYFYAPSAQDMEGIYANIAKGIKEQYVIGYTTHNPSFDGTTRTVTATTQGASGVAVYVVNSKPVITLSQQTLLLSTQSQQPNVMLTISGWVTDLDAKSQGQNLSAALYYCSASSSTFTKAALTLTDQGSGKYVFDGQIPGSVVKEPGILYYLYASDGLLETYSPFNYNVLPYSISVLQNHAPIILHTPVTSATINQPVTILANVTDPDSGDSVSKVEIYYRIHNASQSTPYLVVNMTSSNGVDFSGIIPGDKLTAAGVDYFISAWDSHQVRADTKESYITTVTQVGTELLAASFAASGLWIYNSDTAAWSQVSSANPENMVYCGSTLYADYGSYGLYRWDGAGLTKLTSANPENMVTSGSTLYVDFAALGLYKWDGAWTQLASVDPGNMVASGSTLYVNFGASYGLYKWDGTAWTQLTSVAPENMVTSGAKLYGDFGAFYGLYEWNGTSWSRLTRINPENMVASNSVLYGNFGALYGVFKWDGAVWEQLTTVKPENMVASDSALYGDFGALGLYKWAGAWDQLTTANSENIVASDSALYADFGVLGLYKWADSSWSQLNGSNPVIMAVSN
jgi:VWFA-related protein